MTVLLHLNVNDQKQNKATWMIANSSMISLSSKHIQTLMSPTISGSLCHKILRTCTFIMKNCERDRNAVISQISFPLRHPMLLSGPKKVSHLCCNNRWSQSDCLNAASLQIYSLKLKKSSKNKHIAQANTFQRFVEYLLRRITKALSALTAVRGIRCLHKAKLNN